MTNRIYNYCAFYVKEDDKKTNLGAFSQKDFCYYNMIKAWQATENINFHDAHGITYSVRDTSDWEKTLKPRLHERLNNSKNIILILSSNTINSRALREEIEYGIGELELPVIVIYPDYKEKKEIYKDKI